jgi:tetratricopeptide (TPR) repeat protein
MHRQITSSTVIHGVKAVGSALNLDSGQLQEITANINPTIEEQAVDKSWTEWYNVAKQLDTEKSSQRSIFKIAVALIFLRESARGKTEVSPRDLDQIWTIIKDELLLGSLDWQVRADADGSHSIVLWCITKDSRVEESLFLRLWLPDGVREDSASAIHMHPHPAQSWVLVGEASDQRFTMTSTGSDPSHIAHTRVFRDHGREDDGSLGGGPGDALEVREDRRSVRLSKRSVELHKRDDHYHVPKGSFYALAIEPDAIYAEISLFESDHHETVDTTILETTSRKGALESKTPTNFNVSDYAKLIRDLRSWECHEATGLGFSDRGDWEEALRSYRTALHICRNNVWLKIPRYAHVSLGEIGHMHRMLGRYSLACESVEEAVLGTPHSRFRVECSGELALIYRHMDRLEEAKRVAEEQYKGAVELNLEKFACRAIGTAGVLNYQLYLENNDKTLLNTAIDQLNERVERAQIIEDVVLEAIGTGRLSLCYMARGDHHQSVRWAKRNYDLMKLQHDASKIGFSRAFLGRALLSAGRLDEAVAVINEAGACSPVISLCNEISGEHRQYIIDLINAGADLKLRDEKGYSALECTVYNGDSATTAIIEKGLQAQIQREGGNVVEEIAQLKYEANLRKGYRDIFQDKMRPVLLQRDQQSTLQALRHTYATCLAEDHQKRSTFDGLKYVLYTDFVRCGRLPRSSDGYTQEIVQGQDVPQGLYILFISYRWIGKGSTKDVLDPSPDNSVHTQYRRMLRAIGQFLDLHKEVDREQLGIWIVSSSSRTIKCISNAPRTLPV